MVFFLHFDGFFFNYLHIPISFFFFYSFTAFLVFFLFFIYLFFPKQKPQPHGEEENKPQTHPYLFFFVLKEPKRTKKLLSDNS